MIIMICLLFGYMLRSCWLGCQSGSSAAALSLEPYNLFQLRAQHEWNATMVMPNAMSYLRSHRRCRRLSNNWLFSLPWFFLSISPRSHVSFIIFMYLYIFPPISRRSVVYFLFIYLFSFFPFTQVGRTLARRGAGRAVISLARDTSSKMPTHTWAV